MICPNKTCQAEIPDDSLYCDQCKLQILHCEKCGTPGTGKFCGKCGGAMVFNTGNLPPPVAAPAPAAAPAQTPPQAAPVPPVEAPMPPTQTPPVPPPIPPAQTPPQAAPTTAPPAAAAVGGTDDFILAPLNKLFFLHTDGWKMELVNGDILGRAAGGHVDMLGGNRFISGTHAKITLENSTWYIADQQSKNKTFVNSAEAAPFTPVPLKNNDIVQMANFKFVVRIV